MPQITFRGKTYNSEFEMPQEIRQAYQEEQMREASTKSLTDVVDMHPDVRAVYEKAVDRVGDASSRTQQPDNLPTTEDLYRQSAPQELRHLPSDESIYRPAPPIVDPARSNIEPESSFEPRRLVTGLVWALIIMALVYLVMQFLG